MNDKLYVAIKELKNMISSDERVLKLNELENIMEHDETAIKLAYKVDMLSVKFSDLLKIYSLDSKEAKDAQKALYLAKKELDSLPCVLAYKKQYKIVEEIYNKINETIFAPFKEASCMRH